MIKKKMKKDKKAFLYFNKESNEVEGSLFLEDQDDLNKNKDLNCLKIDASEWFDFLNENNGKLFKIINKKLVAEDRPIDPAEEEMRKIKKHKNFLKNSDWYVIRELEGGKKIPVDIKKNREDSRAFLEKNKG